MDGRAGRRPTFLAAAAVSAHIMFVRNAVPPAGMGRRQLDVRLPGLRRIIDLHFLVGSIYT